jgi:hypothetical protein
MAQTAVLPGGLSANFFPAFFSTFLTPGDVTAAVFSSLSSSPSSESSLPTKSIRIGGEADTEEKGRGGVEDEEEDGWAEEGLMAEEEEEEEEAECEIALNGEVRSTKGAAVVVANRE